MITISSVAGTARSAAGRLVRAVRRRADRMLGPRRRRAVSENLRAHNAATRILVVCYGNVCRSPYLEAALARRLPDAQVVSAGFIGPGRGVPEHSLVVAGRRGIDLCGHRSQLMTPALVRWADLVIVMDRHQARSLSRVFGLPPERVIQAGDLDPDVSAGRTIADPWGQPLEVFEQCFTRLDRCADELVRLLGREV